MRANEKARILFFAIKYETVRQVRRCRSYDCLRQVMSYDALRAVMIAIRQVMLLVTLANDVPSAILKPSPAGEGGRCAAVPQ